MRLIVLTTASAALCLAACDSAPAGNEAADANTVAAEASQPSTVNQASPDKAEAAASGDAPALTREYLVGNWAEDNCAEPDVRLNADGSTDGGQWELRGGQLIRITSDGEDPPLDVTPVDADHFQVSFGGLPPQTMQRCG
jgi:hypothetical protein